MDFLRRRRGAPEEEASDEARIVTSSDTQSEPAEAQKKGCKCDHHEEGDSGETWHKVDAVERSGEGEVTAEGDGEEKEKKEKDVTARVEDDHPFLQQRRQKKKYSRAIMFGTTIYWKIILFSIMVAVPAAYGSCLPLLKREVLGDGLLGHLYTALWLYFSTMFLFNYLMTTFSTPGRAQDIDTQETYKVESDTKELDMVYAPRWCTSCQCWKPPRTHHCGICDRCTLRMDHHCPFMGNCIGLYNLGHFLSMYVYVLVGALIGFIPLVFALLPSVLPFLVHLWNIAWTYEWYHILSPAHLTWFFWKEILYGAVINVLGHHGLLLGALTAGTVAGFFACLMLSSTYIPLIYTNSTVIENQLKNKSEYVKLMDDVVVSVGSIFYMHDWRSNLKEVFGNNLWTRLLPIPIRIPLEVGTLPKASKFASEALLSRVEEVKKEGCKHSVKSMEDLGLITTKQPLIAPTEQPSIPEAEEETQKQEEEPSD